MTDNEHDPQPVRVTNPCALCVDGCARPCEECEQPGCCDHDEDCSRFEADPPPPGLDGRSLAAIFASRTPQADSAVAVSAHLKARRAVEDMAAAHRERLAEARAATRKAADEADRWRAEAEAARAQVGTLTAEVERLRQQVEQMRTSTPAAMLREFHHAFALATRTTPGLADIPEDLLCLRGELLREEAKEYADAAEARDLIGIADALADVTYVAYGNALTYGIDLDAVLAEVHRSNMSKLGPDGRPILREDGKVLKGPDYFPPDVAGVLGLAPPIAREALGPAREETT